MNNLHRAAIVVATATLLWGQHGKLAGVFPPAAPDGSLDVIVRYKNQPDQQTLARLQAYKATYKRDLDSIRSSAVTVPVNELGRLAADPEVESIAPDLPLKGTDFNGQPDYGWMTAMNITASRGTLPYDGTGIAVALIDSGLDDRDDLKDSNGKSRIVYKQSFVPGENNPGDAYGHGDLVAGIIGGTGKKSTGGHYDYWIRGIAPNIKFVNLRVLDKNGYSSDSTVIAAIQKAIALKAQYSIRIINLSLGRPISSSYQTDPLCQAVQQAWNAGIVVVVAAGRECPVDRRK